MLQLARCHHRQKQRTAIKALQGQEGEKEVRRMLGDATTRSRETTEPLPKVRDTCAAQMPRL